MSKLNSELTRYLQIMTLTPAVGELQMMHAYLKRNMRGSIQTVSKSFHARTIYIIGAYIYPSNFHINENFSLFFHEQSILINILSKRRPLQIAAVDYIGYSV